MAPQPPDVLAAGVVAFRPGKRVLLVHRPKYDDWSFPKGKLDPGEHCTTAAIREVLEETGLHVRLGPPLRRQRYPLARGMKTVFYWTGRPVGDDGVADYLVNEEIDAVEWVDLEQAERQLSYAYDLATLREAARVKRKTQALVILRHGPARSRKAWRRDDRLRPLLQAGRLAAQQLVPVLAAYDVTRVVSSPSTRCTETVTPFVLTTGWRLETDVRLSEEGAAAGEAPRGSVAEVVDEVVESLAGGRSGAVLCTHRPVLPEVFEALGTPDPRLEAGEMLVAHLRKGAVVATERHHVH